MDPETLKATLLTITIMLHSIETTDLEAYVNSVATNNATYDTIGPIVDPTAYRDMLHSGRRDNLRVQLEITRKLLEARRLIDQLQVTR